MSGGIPAGRLSIEIVAEVARLQSDMDKVKRAVRDASGDIARNAKAANDNLAGIGRGAGAGMKQFSQEAQRANEYLRQIAQTSADVVTRVNAVTGVTGGMRRSAEDFAAYGKELDRLRAQYNPLFAVIQKYRASVDDIRKAHSVGAISAEEMAQAISRERQASLESIASLKGRTTATKEAELAARAAAKAEAEYAKSIEDLQKQANPAGTAQAQLNAQMELAERAFREGRLAADDYAKIIHNLQTRVNLLNTDGFGELGHSGQVAGHHMLNLSFQMQDLGIQLLGAAQSSAPLKLAFTALAQQGSQIYGVIQQSGLGLKAFAAQALAAAGIIKTSGDEALIAAARQAVAHEAVVASLAERAAANVATAEAEVALARTQVANAATATEAAAAHARLAAAEAVSAAAAAEAATAQGALAGAQAASAAATEAASASMVTGLGAVALALLPFVAAITVAAAGFALFDRAVSKGIDTKKMIDGLGLTRDEIKKLKDTSIDAGDVIKATFQVMAERVGLDFTGMGKAWSDVLDWMTDFGRNAMAKLYADTVGTFQAMVAAVKALGSGKGISGALSAAGQTYKAAFDDANAALSKFGKDVAKQAASNKLADLTKQANELKLDRTPHTDRHAESLAREAEATEALINGLYKSADAYSVSTAAGVRARVEAEATAKGIKKQADVQAYVSQQLRKYVAEQVNGSAEQVAAMNDHTRAQEFVNQAIRNGTLDASKASEALADMAEQQKLMTAMSVASMNNDAEGYKAAKKALNNLTEAQLANKKARTETEDQQRVEQIRRSIEDTERETKLTKDLGEARLAAMRGLSGQALEDELARIAAEHAKIAIQVQAEADANRELALGHTKAAAEIMRKAEADKTQVDVAYDIDKQTVAIERYNDQLRDTINLLGDMGKVGQGLGAILGVLTGNTRSVRGPLGDLLNVGMTGKNSEGKEIASTIGEELSKVFKKGGEFAKVMTSALQNASTGMAAGTALFGKQSTTEQLGSAIGGALGGSKLTEKVLSKGLESISKGLGEFAGPLGSIVGGVLGNVLGGALTKVKWGRVTLTSEGVSSTSGNSGSSEKAALAAGNSIYGSLTDLAKQFGGIIGDFGSIAVGVRHGDYRVNANGTSLKVKKGAIDFNDDAEAAVAYAMKLAIERGAINGIRQSTNNLLKSGDDLSAQIDKALSFEGVFTDLKTYLDPVGAELDSIDKEFANLRSIFAEAGATAEEYAQLEQLLTIKRQEAMNKETDALNDIKSRIAEAQGDDATVTAIARAKELRDATSDAQRALLQQLYAIEDANAAQEALTAAQEAAATAAEQLKQAWESVGDSILDEVNRIRGISGGSDAASFATLQGQFNAAVAAARAGDQDAAGKLVDLSQSLLDAAGNAATSRQELERIKAETAASLEGVYNSIGSITGTSSTSASATVDSASTAAAGSTSTSTSSTTDVGAAIISLTDKVEQMRSEMNSGNAAIVSGVNRSAKVLENVSPSGDAINVANG